MLQRLIIGLLLKCLVFMPKIESCLLETYNSTYLLKKDQFGSVSVDGWCLLPLDDGVEIFNHNLTLYESFVIVFRKLDMHVTILFLMFVKPVFCISIMKTNSTTMDIFSLGSLSEREGDVVVTRLHTLSIRIVILGYLSSFLQYMWYDNGLGGFGNPNFMGYLKTFTLPTCV